MDFSHTICGVCSKPYNDPRILPCLHSFCQQCLRNEIEKSGSQQVFKCPTCERSTSIPEGGASGLPQNLHLGFEVEVARYMSTIVSNSEVCCDQCTDGISGPAVVFCCTCYQFLCQLCYDYHKRHRQLSKHNMVGLDQEGAKQLQTTMKPRDHCEDNKLNLYCETCKCLIHTYKDFIPVAHKDHSITELSTVAIMYQRKIEDVIADTDGIVNMVTGAIDGNNEMMQEVEISKRNALLAINQAFEILQQTLEDRKKTLLSEVEAISLSKTTALTLQNEQLEKIVEDIGHYTEVATHILQTHTDHEVVALGGLIPTELQAKVKRVQTMSLTPNHHSHMSLSVQTDDLVKEVSRFGHIFELSPSPSSSTWTSTSVAKKKTRFHVKVEIKTSEGEGYPHGGVQVKGEMRSKVHSGAVVYGEVEDHRDGTYTITLTPQATGPHQLVITMDGQHVQNSPHDLDVGFQHDYHTLSNAHQVIICSSGPYCVAIHDNGDMYVGSDARCIYVFDQSGQLKNAIGSYGSGDGQFSTPYVTIKGDVLYVADYGNHRVQKLTSRGEFLLKFGQRGSGQGQFTNPTAVIVDSNNRLIVSDQGNHRIQIFHEDGGWLLTIDGKGSGNHCFQNPWGLALDPQGNIHVAAHTSNTIIVFTVEGVYVRKYGNLNRPIGIAIDDEGCSIVGEYGCHSISIFDPKGNKVYTLVNLINHPYGTALDPKDGSVYVANYGAKTVVKYMYVSMI